MKTKENGNSSIILAGAFAADSDIEAGNNANEVCGANAETHRATDNTAVIVKSYRGNYTKVLNFIASRINSMEDAENLTQDVWLRLLTYNKPIESETVLPLIFVIARNLINDYLRRVCHANDYTREWLENNGDRHEISPEMVLSACEIARKERERVECLPAQRRIIYVMNRYEEKTADEIASALSLSKRTVENHLRLGRHDVRDYIAAIV